MMRSTKATRNAVSRSTRTSLPKWMLGAAAGLVLGLSGAQARPLNLVLNADMRSSNPGVNRDGNTDGIMLNIVEGLVGYGKDGRVKPVLAEKIETSDDGLTYTFRLRQGVTFHNGAPMTSADVLWSWQRYMQPATEWRCLSEFDGRNGLKVEKVGAPDPRTFVMTINKPHALFLDSLARTDCAMAAVIHPDSVAENGSWKAPVGTGPFKLDRWVRGQYLTLKRFDAYVSPPGDKPDGGAGKKIPLISDVRVSVVADASTIKAGLASGALDISKVQNIDVAELSKNKNLAIAEDLTGGRNAILFQTQDPLLGSVTMRRAIAAALDVPQLVSMVSDGKATPNSSAVKTGSFYYDAVQATSHAYDPALARRLLKESGYKGERLKITTNNRENMPSLNIAIVMQQMLREVGIESDIDIVEWGTHMDRFLKGNYQMMVHSYSSRIDPSLSYEHFTGPKDKQPRKVWDNPQAQAMLEESMTVSDSKRRQSLFDDMHRLMLEDVPLIILFNTLDPWAMSSKVKGFEPWEGSPPLWGVTLAE